MKPGALRKLSSVTTVSTARGKFCVRRLDGQWIAHSAACPHLLGPLDEASPDQAGSITCPWHGYRFDVRTGENLDGRCRPLAPAPELREENGKLYLLDISSALPPGE